MLAGIPLSSDPKTTEIRISSEVSKIERLPFDKFRIVEQIGRVKFFDLYSDSEIECLGHQMQYSAYKLGCVASSLKIASSIAEAIESPSFGGVSDSDILLVVPPTYKDLQFPTSQERLAKNVSRMLPEFEFLDWGLRFSGESGRSYSQSDSIQDRRQNVRRCLINSDPSTDIRNRDVIIVDDIWVTGSAALETCAYLRGKGARSVRYCGYTSLSSDLYSNEYLLNGFLLLKRGWSQLESILAQKELPTRHLFNLVLEDPTILDIFVRDCPKKVQTTFFQLAERYYAKRAIHPPLRKMPYSNALEKVIGIRDIRDLQA